MLVAVPSAAFVIVAAATANEVVPATANQTSLLTSPELTMVMETPPFAVTADGNTVFWLVGAVLSTVNAFVEAAE